MSHFPEIKYFPLLSKDPEIAKNKREQATESERHSYSFSIACYLVEVGQITCTLGALVPL